MTVTISRLYDNYSDAQRAVTNLESAGVPHSDLSIVANNSDNWYSSDKKVDRDRDGVDDRAEGAATGAGVGAGLGGAAGLLAVVAAAVSGAALLLADIPTFRELWTDAALFVSPDDGRGWRQALSELIENGILRERLAAKARASARQFTLPRQAAQLHALYTTLTTPAVEA